MKKILILLWLTGVGGCTTPEPRIVTKEIKVAVPTPCKPALGVRPALMTKAEIYSALQAAQNTDDKVKILTTQALLYIGWVPVLEAGIAGCEGVPTEPKVDAGG